MNRSIIFSRSTAAICCLSLLAILALSSLWYAQPAHALARYYACYDVAVFNDPGSEVIGVLKKGGSFSTNNLRSGEYTFGNAGGTVNQPGWVKTVALCSWM